MERKVGEPQQTDKCSFIMIGDIRMLEIPAKRFICPQFIGLQLV